MTVVISLIKDFARIYSDTPAFLEIFAPIQLQLNSLPCDKFCAQTASIFQTTNSYLSSLIESSKLKRRPLQLQKRKAVAIETYIPKFQEQYV